MVRKYEDMLAEGRSVRKPGYLSPREQEAAQRKKFTRELIEALEDAQHAQAARVETGRDLAKAAYNKLQFDFPLVSQMELSALVSSYRRALDSNSAPPFKLTGQLAATVAEAAAALPATLPPSAAAQRSVGHASQCVDQGDEAGSAGAAIPAELATGPSPSSGTAGTAGTAQEMPASAAGPSVPCGNQKAAEAAQRLQATYQQLAACLFIKLLRFALGRPLAEAAVLLDRYEGQPESSSQPQPTANEADGYRLHAASGEAANGQQAAAAQAEQEDEDDFEYKDMDVPAPPSSTARRSRRPATTESVATAGAAGPAAATQKLLQLLRHVSYALVADGGVWREMDMGGDVVACLGLVQRHEKADELQGITLVLLALIIDRLGASPADMDLLSQSWTALGVAGEPKAACTRTVGRATSPAIPAACRAALSLATALPGRLQTASAHRQLWSQIHEGLLPTLARCLEMLAACKGPDFRGEAGTDLALICCILEFLVMQAPAGAEIGDDLLQAGAFRALVLLFASHTAHPAAVPLRRAMLLLCAASARLGAWAAAVPAFKQRLSSEDFLECGDAALHGAVWPLLLPSPEQAPHCAAQHSAQSTQSTPAAAPPTRLAQLLASAARDPSVDALQRLQPLLQLLLDCKRAAGSRRRLWDGGLDAQLRQVAQAVRTASSTAGDGAAGRQDGGPDARLQRPPLGPPTLAGNGAVVGGTESLPAGENQAVSAGSPSSSPAIDSATAGRAALQHNVDEQASPLVNGEAREVCSREARHPHAAAADVSRPECSSQASASHSGRAASHSGEGSAECQADEELFSTGAEQPALPGRFENSSSFQSDPGRRDSHSSGAASHCMEGMPDPTTCVGLVLGRPDSPRSQVREGRAEYQDLGMDLVHGQNDLPSSQGREGSAEHQGFDEDLVHGRSGVTLPSSRGRAGSAEHQDLDGDLVHGGSGTPRTHSAAGVSPQQLLQRRLQHEVLKLLKLLTVNERGKAD